MNKRLKIYLTKSIFTGIVLFLITWLSIPKISRYATGRHQQSVSKSLSVWGGEYETINNDEDAVRSVDMLEYIQSYYVPSETYRGPLEIEQDLQKKRRQCSEQITTALEIHTGLNYGHDVESWTKWANLQRAKQKDLTLPSISRPQ